MYEGFNSYAAEMAIANLISQHRKLKPLRFSTNQLLEVARSHPIGLKRLEAAEPYLKQEYGIPLKNGKIHLIWESLPSSVLLDYAFGIDAVFQYLGWSYGLDITVNVNDLSRKMAKQKKLFPLLKELQFERVGVCLLESGLVDPKEFLTKLPKNEHFCFSL
ncbi:hypothetical protein C7H19_15140 [Aphanothece hegewaldii CCALA 016]|uniref:Uncharacterized protein n=1 Tax=Aphanothece hegewaldii CCALA 016 TaxID=2107694 RepID=A0A2T1LVK4_9CHRO|nr:hypothetical protein [Aphanothece hegewaldii]PSF35759.1 hypothetical protein C7H19_15140 [Aphanothece hegewaldii CCALA 016]